MAAEAPPASTLVGEVLSVLKGLREGLAYGTRIRLPHALVMTALFRSGSLHKLGSGVLGLTWEHARRLGMFVAAYKGIMAALRVARGRVGVTPTGVPAASADAAIAGGLAAYLVWYGGSYNGVAYQIALYLLGRVVVAGVRYAAACGVPPFAHIPFQGGGYPALVVGVWAAVMWLYEDGAAREGLQRSLVNSMHELYRDSSRVAVTSDGGTTAVVGAGAGLDWASLLPNAATGALLTWAAARAANVDLLHGLLGVLGLQGVHVGPRPPPVAPTTPPRPAPPAARVTATPVRSTGKGGAAPAPAPAQFSAATDPPPPAAAQG